MVFELIMIKSFHYELFLKGLFSQKWNLSPFTYLFVYVEHKRRYFEESYSVFF